MGQLVCGSCKASLTTDGKNIEFVTCAYCRSMNKNPNYQPPINHTEKFQQNATQQPRPQQRPPQNQQDAQLLTAFLTTLNTFGGGGRRRRGRRRRRRGCGSGCITIIIIAIAIYLAWLFRAQIITFISDLI